MSCTKARAALEQNNLSLAREQNARKERIDDEAAWHIAAKVQEVCVAKGKRVVRFVPGPDTRTEILAAVMGPSGNLRAPALLAGNRLWVGYSDALYEALFADLG